MLFCAGDLDELQTYEKQSGLAANTIKQSMLRVPEFRKAVSGHINEIELWQAVASMLHLSPSEAPTIAEKYYSSVGLNSELVTFLRTLRPRYKTAILSNAPSTVRNLVTQRFHLDRDVDEIIISAEVGAIKPEPAIYQLAANRLGIDPQNALFIDDESRFTAAAQQIGMQAIQFKDTQQAIIEICRALEHE